MTDTSEVAEEAITTTSLEDALSGAEQASEAAAESQAVAVTASEAAQPEPAPAAAETPKAEGPKWYRDHIEKVNRERAQERQEVERLRAQLQPQQSQALPDPLEDPGGYTSVIERRLEEFALRQTLTISERFARSQHGEVFEEARAWLSTKPDVEAWAIQQPDPWQAAITLYQRERLAEEIGDNPEAWREKERQRLRDEILAEQRTTAPQMRPVHQPASQVRSAAPRDMSGRFTGPTPLGAALKNGA